MISEAWRGSQETNIIGFICRHWFSTCMNNITKAEMWEQCNFFP